MMKHRRLCVVIFAWLSVVGGLQARAASPLAKAERPNIVFILLDNLGKEWFGAYGSQENVTPQLDRLASAGVRIENCYTPTVCGPSRIVALTGRYLLRSGFTVHHDAALYSGGGLDPRREVTFARPLKAAGYATGIFGKWQINNLYDEPDVIRQHGFDEYLLWPGSLDRDAVTDCEYSQFMERVRANDFVFTTQMIRRIESRYWDVVTLDHQHRREVHRGRFGPDVFQEAACRFIRRHKDRPFLLYLPSPLTHGWTFTDPVTPTPLNRDSSRPHDAMYRDMIRYADLLRVGRRAAAPWCDARRPLAGRNAAGSGRARAPAVDFQPVPPRAGRQRRPLQALCRRPPVRRCRRFRRAARPCLQPCSGSDRSTPAASDRVGFAAA